MSVSLLRSLEPRCFSLIFILRSSWSVLQVIMLKIETFPTFQTSLCPLRTCEKVQPASSGRFHSHLPADIWALLSARSSLSEAASIWLVSNSIFRKNNCELWQEFSLTLSLKPSFPPAPSGEQLSVLSEALSTWAISATCKASELRSRLRGHRASVPPSEEPCILASGCRDFPQAVNKYIEQVSRRTQLGQLGFLKEISLMPNLKWLLITL